MNGPKCDDHSGCLADIKNLKNSDKTQWEAIGKNRDRIDQIITRLNITLGGVVVACLMLIIDILIVRLRP